MNKHFANFFVFTTGAVIMAIELTASRLLAPYFGSSIFVWGNIIGVVMITLAIGYWWGGRLADRKPELKTLASLIFICGIFLAFLPVVFKPFVGLIIGLLGFSSMFVFAFICFWILIFMLAFPLIILGMSSPFIIRILNKQVDTTGKVAGSVFAASSVGSIFGVFLATFVTVPFLGSMETILLSSMILILLSGLSFKSKYKIFTLLICIPIFIYIIFGMGPISDHEGLIFEKETPYQYVKVIDDGDWRFLQFNEGAAIQSYINFNAPHFLTSNSYYDYFNLLPYINDKENEYKEFLIIGGGGGTAVKQLISFWQPKINIDLVEIDKDVINIAKKYFNMNEKQVTVFNQDGRFYLEKTDKNYDYIIVDAYSNQLFIPFHVTTDEFFKLASTKLKDNGILAINVNADGYDSDLLQKIVQTIKKNYNYVAVLSLDNVYNHLIFASSSDLNFDFSNKDIDKDLTDRAELFYNIRRVDAWSDDNMILTDNRAPIEFLTDKMVLKLFLQYVMN